FSILMFNAWELLLKARILKENGNRSASIEVRAPVTRKDGTQGARTKAKLTRSGNPMTIEAMRCAALVQQYATDNIDAACVENLGVLAEIRDSCIHLRVVGPGLGKRIQEVGA